MVVVFHRCSYKYIYAQEFRYHKFINASEYWNSYYPMLKWLFINKGVRMMTAKFV